MNEDPVSHSLHSRSINARQPISSIHRPAFSTYRDQVGFRKSSNTTEPSSSYLDDEVQIRGFHIKMREIELAIESMPGVRQCATAVRVDSRGHNQLIAYLVGDHQPPPSIGELRSLLKQMLPNYMIPSAFIAVEHLPLAPSGEVDREALPPPHPTLVAYGEIFVEPNTPTEELLADIWSESLGVTRVGINDNFFELGGHPLLVEQVVSQMNQTLQLELPMQALLDYPTIAELAPVVEAMLLTAPQEVDERYLVLI
ncbi:phosphopantetheine-binding protein [Verrucomicrobiota bacterium sgz303538]